MKNHKSPRRLATAIALAILAWMPAAPGLASGFQLIEQNGSGLGNAFAGQAAGVKDASAISYNPAALTRLEGRALAVGVDTIGLSATFADNGSTPPSVPAFQFPIGVQPTGGGDAGGWIPVPNAYLSWQIAEELWVGLGVSVPFGLKTDWEEDWLGRFHGLKSEVQTININPTVATKLHESFSVGAGVSYQRLGATLSQGVHVGGISFVSAAQAGGLGAAALIAAQLGPDGPAREGRVAIEGHNWAWGFNAGALLQLGENGHLGASYRSKVTHDLSGDAVFTNAPTFSTAGPAGPIGAALNAAFADGKVTTRMELPDTLSLAASYEGEKVELLADWTRTGWSSVQDLTIMREDGGELSSVGLNFEDSWRAGLGLNYKLNDTWKLRLGTALDQAPVRDEFRTPRLPDADRVWAASGFEWSVSKGGAVDVAYAHVFIDEASSDLPNQDAPTSTPKGALIGVYTGSVNIISVQYTLTF